MITFMGFHRQFNGYGYATMKIAGALQAARPGIRIVDMRKGENGRDRDDRRWNLNGLAVAMTTPDWLERIQATDGVVLFTMFETTRLPVGWAGMMNRNARAVIVPSEWCRQVFRENRVIAPIYVAPLGVDKGDYPLSGGRRNGRFVNRPYTFLWSGTPDFRKGWDLAYRCFLQAFGKREDVRLVLHFRTLPPAIQSCGDRNVELVSGPRELAEVLAMYRDADCFVFPSRGEGWGLPPREAAATGLPVIATDHGGLHEEIEQWAIPLRVLGMSPVDGYGPWQDVGEWAEPDPEALVELYRWVDSQRVEARRIGRKAAQFLAETGWDRTAKAILDCVGELREIGAVRGGVREGDMRVKWTGPQVVRRILGPYVWDASTGYEQDVPEAMALELVTMPGEQFVLANPVDEASLVRADPVPLTRDDTGDGRKQVSNRRRSNGVR